MKGWEGKITLNIRRNLEIGHAYTQHFPLFAHYGIYLEENHRNSFLDKLADFFLCTNSCRRFIILSYKFCSRFRLHAPTNQPCFPFMENSSSNGIVRIVSGIKQEYIYSDIYHEFKGIDPSVSRACISLERHGVFMLGQLIQLTESELGGYPYITPKIISQMRERLAKLGLDFGMTLTSRQRGQVLSLAAPGL